MGPLRREFWEYVAPACGEAAVGLSLTDSVDSYVAVQAGISRAATYAVVRTSKGQLAVQFYSNWNNTQSLFNWLRLHRSQIEAGFDEQMLWINPPANGQQTLEVMRLADLADREAWPEHREWLVNRLVALQRALGPLIGRQPRREPVPEPCLEAFLLDMETFNPAVMPAVRRLMDWASREMSESSFTANGGALTWTPWLKVNGIWHQLVRLVTDGSIELRFTQLKKAPFDDQHLREALLQRVNLIPHVSLSSDALGSNPRLPLAMMQSDEAFDQLLGVLNWFVDKAHGDGKVVAGAGSDRSEAGE